MIVWELAMFVSCTQLLTVTVADPSPKRGIVHMGADYVCGDFDALDNVSWWYDYTQELKYFNNYENEKGCSKRISSYNIQFVPMIWGSNRNIPNFAADGTVKAILGYNEANHYAQANLSATEAAEAWPAVVAKINKTLNQLLVCPSAAACGEGCHTKTAAEWFTQFFAKCSTSDCDCDYIAAHSYICDPHKVISDLKSLHDLYNKPIWLTEVACSGVNDTDVMLVFMQTLIPMLESATFVYRYSWYKARQEEAASGSAFVYPAISLLEQDSATRTPLGDYYNTGKPVEIATIPETCKGTQVYTISGVCKEEAMIVLASYEQKYTSWSVVLNSISRNIRQLSKSAQAFYVSKTKQEKKPRIKSFFNKLVCTTTLTEISDDDIRKEVDRIQKLPGTNQVSGTLKINCK